MSETIKNLKGSILAYARSRKLNNTDRAVGYVEQALAKNWSDSETQLSRKENAMKHVLEVCEMIVDLEPPITDYEMDNLLSAILLHILPETWPIENLHEKIVDQLGYEEETFQILDLIINHPDLTHDEAKELCQKIQTNKLALIAALADRGNILQHVYKHSTWVAHRYLNESRIYYLPMGIYGKEHYRDMVGIMAILMEKLRTLMEVAEIFLTRFEVREAELNQDILALNEENATIRGIIRDFRGQV